MRVFMCSFWESKTHRHTSARADEAPARRHSPTFLATAFHCYAKAIEQSSLPCDKMRLPDVVFHTILQGSHEVVEFMMLGFHCSQLGSLISDRKAVFWQHGRICFDWEACLKRKLSSSDAGPRRCRISLTMSERGARQTVRQHRRQDPLHVRQTEVSCVSRRRTMSTDINISVDAIVNLDDSRQLLMIDLAQHGMKVGKAEHASR